MLKRIVLMALMIGLVSGMAWSKNSIESVRRVVDVVIDAVADEWHDSTTTIKGEEFQLGVQNDDEYLYLCLTSRNPMMGRQLMRRGLVLQLSVKGGDPLRIQFPVGMRRDQQREEFDSFLLSTSAKDGDQRVALDNDFGIELRIGGESGEFVYELKIPLSVSEIHPYAIGGTSGDLSLKIDTPTFDRESMGGRGRSGGGGGGGMGRGGGGGGGMGGGGGGMGRGGGGRGEGRQMPEPIHIKARIKLAAG